MVGKVKVKGVQKEEFKVKLGKSTHSGGICGAFLTSSVHIADICLCVV